MAPPAAHGLEASRAPADADVVSTVPSLAWPEDPAALSYDVEWSTNELFTSSVQSRVVVANTYPLEADLAPGQYFWRVRSNLVDGTDGPNSPTWSFTRAPAAGPQQTAPNDGIQLQYPDNLPVLAWMPVPGAQSYSVEMADNPDFTGATVSTTSNTSLTPPAALVHDGTKTYHWRVRARLAVAGTVNSDWSATRTFSFRWAEGAAPILLSPAPDAAATYPTFGWTAVPGAARYLIQVSLDDAFTDASRVITATVPSLSYVPTVQLAATSHYWRVRSLDTRDNGGPWSQTGRFTVRWFDRAHADEVGRPDGITVTGVAGSPSPCSDNPTTDLCLPYQTPLNKFLMTWEPVAGASHYEVQFSASSAFSGGAESKTSTTCKSVRPALTTYQFGTAKSGRKVAGSGACNFLRVATSVKPTRVDITDDSSPDNPLYVRIRAVAVGVDGSEVSSLWSNEARAGETRSGLIPQIQFSAPDESDAAGSLSSTPAELISPAPGAESPDLPVFRWKPVPGAGAYLIAISKATDFAVGSEAANFLNTNLYPYYVTPNTYFIPQEVFPDNNAGQSYYWYVLPCATYDSAIGRDCRVPDAAAINNPDPLVMRSFRKVTPKQSGAVSATSPLVAASPDRRSPAETSVLLSWDDRLVPGTLQLGTLRYEVDLNNGTLDGTPNFSTDATSLLLPQASGLVAGAGYKWRVRAVDGTGAASPWSDEQQFTAPTAAGPAGAAASTATPTQDLSWMPDPGADAYELEVYADTSGTFPIGSRVSLGGSSTPATDYPRYDIPDWLSPGQYTWRVRSVDSLRNRSQWTSGGTFTVLGSAAALQSPADGEAVDATDLVLSWAPAPDAATFEAVKYRVDILPKGSSTPLRSNDVMGTAYTPSGTALPAGEYQWRVRSLIGTSTLRDSAVSPLRSLIVRTVPDVPAQVSAKAVGTAAALTWKAPTTGTPPTEYVYRIKEGTDPWTDPQATGAATTSTTIQGLSLGKTYTLAVAGRNAVGQGKWSTPVAVTMPNVPGAPAPVTTTAGIGSLVVKWTSAAANGSTVTGYEVRAILGGATVSSTQTAGTITTATLIGLKAGATYLIRVWATNAVGAGSVAEATSLAVLAQPKPGTPGALAAKAVSPGRFAVTWAKASGTIAEMRVGWRKSGSTTWTDVKLPATATTATIPPATSPALARGTAYEIRAYAVNAGGSGAAAVTKATTANVPGVPGAFKVTSASGRVNLTWSRPLDGGLALAGYSVVTSTNGSTFTQKLAPGPTTLSASFTATRGSYVWMKVRARNAVGFGAYTTTVRIRVA